MSWCTCWKCQRYLPVFASIATIDAVNRLSPARTAPLNSGPGCRWRSRSGRARDRRAGVCQTGAPPRFQASMSFGQRVVTELAGPGMVWNVHSSLPVLRVECLHAAADAEIAAGNADDDHAVVVQRRGGDAEAVLRIASARLPRAPCRCAGRARSAAPSTRPKNTLPSPRPTPRLAHWQQTNASPSSRPLRYSHSTLPVSTEMREHVVLARDDVDHAVVTRAAAPGCCGAARGPSPRFTCHSAFRRPTFCRSICSSGE